MTRFVTTSVPGRVCFAGESLDWMSGPSILCAVNLRITVKVSPLPQNSDFILLRSGDPFNVEQRVSLTDIGNYKKHTMDYVHAAVKVLIDQGAYVPPLQIDVSSQMPVRAGLSSSAAVSVATLAALNKFLQLGLSEHKICALAYIIEREELKIGVGQMDFYSCGLGGLMYINCATVPPHPIERYELPTNLKILIVDTLTPRDTSAVISMKRKRLSESEPLIMAYIRHAEAAVKRIHSLLGQSEVDKKELGTLVSLCQDYLREYMLVSTHLLNSCVEVCLKNDAIGAKLTGSGMGGCMFALVPASKVPKVEQALASYPVKTYVTDISYQGLIVHQNDVEVAIY